MHEHIATYVEEKGSYRLFTVFDIVLFGNNKPVFHMYVPSQIVPQILWNKGILFLISFLTKCFPLLRCRYTQNVHNTPTPIYSFLTRNASMQEPAQGYANTYANL